MKIIEKWANIPQNDPEIAPENQRCQIELKIGRGANLSSRNLRIMVTKLELNGKMVKCCMIKVVGMG